MPKREADDVSMEERRLIDDGFTLIELAVVIMIIGLLLMLAIPAFLNVQDHGHDKSAQNSLRQIMGAAASYYSDASSYDAPASFFLQDAPEVLVITTGASHDSRLVRITTSPTMFQGAVYSTSNKCFEFEQTEVSLRLGSFEVTPTRPCEPGNSTNWSPNSWGE